MLKKTKIESDDSWGPTGPKLKKRSKKALKRKLEDIDHVLGLEMKVERHTSRVDPGKVLDVLQGVLDTLQNILEDKYTVNYREGE